MPFRRGRPGLLGTVARTAVITGTATAVHVAMTGGKQQQAAAAQQQAADQAVADPGPDQDVIGRSVSSAS